MPKKNGKGREHASLKSKLKKVFGGKTGDSGSVAEELLAGTSEILRRCGVVERTVREYDFKLEEALDLYRVTPEQYKNYLQDKKKNTPPAPKTP